MHLNPLPVCLWFQQVSWRAARSIPLLLRIDSIQSLGRAQPEPTSPGAGDCRFCHHRNMTYFLFRYLSSQWLPHFFYKLSSFIIIAGFIYQVINNLLLHFFGVKWYIEVWSYSDSVLNPPLTVTYLIRTLLK